MSAWTVCWVLLVLVLSFGPSWGQRGRCGEWQYGQCQKMNKRGGQCGRGTKLATRTGNGTLCELEKTVPCRVPCPGDKKVCKYRKGQWGQCDAATLKRVRTDTLMPELSDPSCQPTRPFQKACKKKMCEYGRWSTYGPCENGFRTRTRPILAGTPEQCGEKAKKSKRCSSDAH